MRKFTLLIALAMIIQGTVLSQSCLPNGITFTTQSQIDNFQTNNPNCTEIGGHLKVDGESIDNLDGLNVVTHIGGRLEIKGCDILSSLTGLSNLTSLGGNLIIAGNDALFDLTGMEGLTSIGGNLEIRANPYLLNCNGLDNVTSIGGGFYLFYNSNMESFDGLDNLTSLGAGMEIGAYIIGILLHNPSLKSLEGLSNLTSIGGDIKIRGCDILTSLSGLDNIAAASITSLTINSNPVLSTCAVQSICDYLANPTGVVSIYDNADGCGDEAEVAYACQSVGVPDINFESEFSIYPNPAKEKLFISSNNGMSIDEIIIYNQIGQKVLQEAKVSDAMDISMLKQGVYVIELMSNGLKMRTKLIVE